MSDHEHSELREKIIAAIRTVKDPELPVNLYDLGLIYELDIDDGRNVRVVMTLTTPNCPVAESMPSMVHKAVDAVEDVEDVGVELVWEPAWTGERMSDEAKMQLDMMGISWKDPHAGLGGGGMTGLTVNRSGQPRKQ